MTWIANCKFYYSVFQTPNWLPVFIVSCKTINTTFSQHRKNVFLAKHNNSLAAFCFIQTVANSRSKTHLSCCRLSYLRISSPEFLHTETKVQLILARAVAENREGGGKTQRDALPPSVATGLASVQISTSRFT